MEIYTNLDPSSVTNFGGIPGISQDSIAASQWLPFETWSAIPVAHMSKLEIRAGVWNTATSTWTSTYFNLATPLTLPGLRGRKLSMTFSGNTGKIYLDETLVTGGSFSIPSAKTDFDLRLGITHNHYELKKSGSTYTVVNTGKSNQAETKNYLKGDDCAYAMIYSFSNPDRLSRVRQEQLDAYRRAGLTDSDWRVRTESLNIIGLNWLHQCYQSEEILAGLYNTIPLHHHKFGRVGQERSFATGEISFYIDAGLFFSARNHRTSNFAEALNCGNLGTTFASAMEHGVLEQMQGSGLGATSTVKMVYLANQAGQRMYRATKANWSSVSSELQNYPTSPVNTVAEIGAALNANSLSRALMPRSGKLILNQYKGFGYALEEPTKISMMIGANYGGYNSQPGMISSAELLAWLKSNPSYLAGSSHLAMPTDPLTVPKARFGDPVDVATGAWISETTDLSLGGGDPDGLNFTRFYNSNAAYNNAAGLGYGWTHSYDITASTRSSVKAGLGATNSYQAAPFFAALTVAADLTRNHTTAKEWATAALVIHWAIDQLKYKAVAITKGNQNLEFIEMPDGTFVPPAGMNVTLVRNGSGPTAYFTLTKRHGATMTFLPNGKVDKITDLFGKTQQFSYTGVKLSKVKDGFNRELNFTWVGEKITAVVDTSSRSIGFGYIGDDLTTFTDPEGKTTTYGYDAVHRVKSVKDAMNRTTIENDYDPKGRVIVQRNKGEAARSYNIYYSGYCNIEENPLGGTLSYYYDSRGRSIGTKNALGHSDITQFDGQDRRISYTSPKIERIDWFYDANNNLQSMLDQLGFWTDYFYDSQLRLQCINDKRGYDTTFTYTPKHQLETVTDPLLHVTTNHYFPNGLLEYTIDAENKKTTFAYDAWGQANKITYHDNKFQSMLNNARGDVLTVTDPEARTVTNTYNKRRQLLTTTLPTIIGEAPATTTNVYDDAGYLESTTDAKSNVTLFEHNALGNRTKTTLPALPTGNNVIINTYDLRDWTETSYNSLNHTVTTEWDAAHRVSASIDPLTRRREVLRDANGQPTETKDPLLRITKQRWTARGEQERATDARDKFSTSLYDSNGNLTDYTNRRNKLYKSSYDAANRLEWSKTPSHKQTVMTYYDNNLVKTIKEPSLQTTTLLYNARNLVETKTDPMGAIVYLYDDSNLLKTVTEGATTITRNYDERGRLKTFTTADGDLIQYKYDANNNLTRLTYPPDAAHPTGKQVHYTYNARNLLETVTDWANRTTTYHYDRLGRLTGTTRPNGTSNQIAHDAANQLNFIKESANGKRISYLNFTHDAAGQIKRRFQAPLLKAAWQHPAITATYDDDNRLETINGSNIIHDADGNMTSGAGILPASPSTIITLTYNSRNQLEQAAGISYVYDAEGRRRTLTDTTGTTRDVIDPSGKLLIRINPDLTKTYYVYGLGLLYEANQADATKTYHFDQVGSTIARTNDAGKVVARASYSAYGLITYQSGDLTTPFLYNGQAGVQTDPNGLLNMRARYYSPYLMRFLNADPIGFSGGSNWFSYADGNPISLSDPFGLCAEGGGGNASWGQPWDTRNGPQQFSLMPAVGGGWYDQWGEKHATPCMACHAYNPAAQRNIQGILAGDTGWAITAATVVEAFTPFAYEAAITSAVGRSGSRIASNVTRVGRWMGEAEYTAMTETNMVQESFTGTTHVAMPANPLAFESQAKSGSLYVEFDVPSASIRETQAGWGKILGPNTIEGRLAAKQGLPAPQLPPATNIQHTATKFR
jgi:RHS repeat-associated protein